VLRPIELSSCSISRRRKALDIKLSDDFLWFADEAIE
jgi:hypothetical protein